MSYSDDYKDQQERIWLNRWVPADDPLFLKCPESFREQFRRTLARKRELEAEVNDYKAAVHGLRRILAK